MISWERDRDVQVVARMPVRWRKVLVTRRGSKLSLFMVGIILLPSSCFANAIKVLDGGPAQR